MGSSAASGHTTNYYTYIHDEMVFQPFLLWMCFTPKKMPHHITLTKTRCFPYICTAFVSEIFQYYHHRVILYYSYIIINYYISV